MFNSSNPFGQSPSSPFGSQSGFGQTNNTTNNPFAPSSFGASTPFGAQTGSSMFASTSTGVFGAPQASSPFSSSTTFGASPGFGSSTPAFGASSSPAFGSSASPFGGTSAFGQKPFGFSTPQSSSFGSSTPFGATSTPVFGASSTPAFGATSTPAFGASGTPAFGATSTPAFGATSMPAFGATNTPAFGASSTPAFGATNTPAFGASSAPSFGASTSPAFGSAGNAFGNSAFGGGGFGASNTPAFGASSTPSFGASNTPAFGASSTPAFGASSTPAFGASSTPAFGASSTPSFSFGSSPAFGQSASSFGSGSFGSTPSPFGAQTQGAQASTPTFGGSGFGQSTFGAQQGGSRVMPFTPTTETEANGTQPAGKLESISAMPVYKDKSHEELRWEDYQRGDKGGQLPGGQSAGGAGFGLTTSQPNAFAPAPAFGQTSANPANAFSSPSATNLFGQKTPGFGMTTSNFGSSSFSATTSSNPFGTTTSFFGSSPSFGVTTSSPLFSSSSTPAFGSSSSLFGSSPAQGSTPAFGSGQGFGTSQSPALFSSTPSTGQPGSVFGQTNSAFGQSSSAFGQFGQNTNPAFGQTNNFSTPSTGFGNLFSSSSSLTTSNSSPFGLTTPAAMTPYQPAQPAQSGAFGFNSFAPTQTGNATGFTGFVGQNNFGQGSASQIPVVLQPVPVTNPFGTLPAVPQISIGQDGTASTIRYGISSMPIVDKPAPVRISSVLTSRNLFHRRGRLPLRKYRPGVDGLRVPFFSDESEPSSTPKADAQFMPRENPRALFIRPYERKKLPSPKDGQTPVHENGKSSDGGVTNASNHNNKDKAKIFEVGEQSNEAKANQKPNGTHTTTGGQKDGSYNSPNGHTVVDQETDIEALLPKLHHGDYYTEPRIQELAAKERVDPGYCSRVKDFVVGRHGYGSIKFIGETDVRGLDLESLVQFNKKEVIVYMDESDKPPVGEGLNKPAEVTLLNIKYIDKKTGKQITEGERMEKYKEMLKRKAEEQGAEFVSYDAVKGEWKFSVKHFSSYKLGDDDDELE